MAKPKSLEKLRAEARGCRACPLWKNATQTVFGEGAAHARIMLVGEVPGDTEDREGHVFAGPAGRVLDEALAAAGLDRAHLYVTNAVKHFKWEPRGKRRLHKTPSQREVEACRPWLEGELAAVKPVLVVALGATASKALLGPAFRITKDRGKLQRRDGLPPVIATYHPSFVLRTLDRPEGEEIHKQFIEDLRTARKIALQDDSDT
ncbi:MAG TPA: UdgX family uracil-DNA binding protein [Usitatibacter sp.]|nr:UdgX family uracil-DNA binding protein [Usitatibacter sp.]